MCCRLVEMCADACCGTKLTVLSAASMPIKVNDRYFHPLFALSFEEAVIAVNYYDNCCIKQYREYR